MGESVEAHWSRAAVTAIPTLRATKEPRCFDLRDYKDLIEGSHSRAPASGSGNCHSRAPKTFFKPI